MSRKKLIIIIVSIILAIFLCVAWFMLRNSHHAQGEPGETEEDMSTQEAPDSIRVRHINLIKNALQNLIKRGQELPMPDAMLTLNFGEISRGFQGQMSVGLYDILGLNELLDPKGGHYFYAVSGDKKTFEVMAIMDDQALSNATSGNMFLYRSGTNTDIFTMDKDGVPLVTKKLIPQTLDLATKEARILVGLDVLKSCLDIYNVKTSTRPKSGIYTIDIAGKSTKVFCDMQTDGGGWTLFYANNGHSESSIQKSYVEMRGALTTTPFDDISAYDDPNLAGLLDFKHFIELGAKQILIRNRAGDAKKWVRFTFSSSRALEWALGPAILGKTDVGCHDLPRGATWSIVNNDKTIMYNNLTQIMNHVGNSWGVSHDAYYCNNYTTWKNPHIGFYNSSSNKYIDRARSDDGVGWLWGEKNEYRYFIK